MVTRSPHGHQPGKIEGQWFPLEKRPELDSVYVYRVEHVNVKRVKIETTSVANSWSCTSRQFFCQSHLCYYGLLYSYWSLFFVVVVYLFLSIV